MEPADLTVQILREIRDEARKTNERLDQTNQRLDHIEATLSARIDATNEGLQLVARRQTEGEVRIATEIVALAKAVKEVKDLLEENLAVRKTVEDHERRISALESRTGN